MGAMTALESAGVAVPHEMSVVGIDDISFAFLARPALTTISVPREAVGMTSFKALDHMLKLKSKRGSDYSLRTELMIRRSTAQARKGDIRRKRPVGKDT